MTDLDELRKLQHRFELSVTNGETSIRWYQSQIDEAQTVLHEDQRLLEIIKEQIATVEAGLPAPQLCGMTSHNDPGGAPCNREGGHSGPHRWW